MADRFRSYRRGPVSRRIDKTAAWSEILESRIFLSAVPSPLSDADIGTPTGGSADYNAGTGTFTVVGAGSDIFGTADAFHFVSQPLEGDGVTIVRIVSNPDASGLAGLDIRSSLDPSAANMFIGVRSDGTVFVNERQSDGGSGGNDYIGQPEAFPEYLELIRTGSNVQALVSPDGTTYTALASDNIGLPDTALVGMGVASQSDNPATATFDTFSSNATDVTPPEGVLASPTTLFGPQLTDTDFTITYTDNSEVDATSIGDNNILLTGPNGYSQAATLVSADPSGATVNAVYSVPALTTFGTYQANLASNQVQDISGNFVAAGSLGTFDLDVDSQNPTASVTSAPTIVSASPSTYSFDVTYSDNGQVDAGTIATGNAKVLLPNATLETATLTSTSLTSGTSVVAAYTIPTPTVNGNYTVEAVGGQVADATGNFVPAGQIGSFTVAIPPPQPPATGSIAGALRSQSGTLLSGQTVFLDTNDNGILDSGETSTTTDAQGAYSFADLAAGTYHVVQIPSSGEQVLEPAGSGGTQSVAIAAGQVVSGINFVDGAANNAAASADLTGALVSRVPTSAVEGTKQSVKVRITNNGPGKAQGTISVALLASTDGSISNFVGTLRSVQLKLNLAAHHSTTTTLSFTIPTGLTAGSYKLVAVIDSTNAIAETNKANNIVTSSAIQISPAIIDLTGTLTSAPPAAVIGKRFSAKVLVKDVGNSAAKGKMSISLYESATQSLGVSPTLLATFSTLPINIKANGHQLYTLSAKLSPAAIAGDEYLVAVVNSGNTITESNSGNNVAPASSKTAFS
jgi:hypothetical protein